MATSDQSIVFFMRNNEAYMKTLALLTLLSKGGPKVVASELTRIALMWQREIKLHMPVDVGLARASVAVAPAEIDMLYGVVAAVGSNVPYVPYLEFDEQGRIAHGQVKNWKPGDPPILDWPAKRAQASKKTVVSVDEEGGARGAGRNVLGQFASRKATNSAEFMPPFRGSWQIIAPRVVDRLRKRVGDLIQQGKISA